MVAAEWSARIGTEGPATDQRVAEPQWSPTQGPDSDQRVVEPQCSVVQKCSTYWIDSISPGQFLGSLCLCDSDFPWDFTAVHTLYCTLNYIVNCTWLYCSLNCTGLGTSWVHSSKYTVLYTELHRELYLPLLINELYRFWYLRIVVH